MTPIFLVIRLQRSQLERWLLREPSRSPDLSVGMRIRTSHCGTLVLKDLHVPILIFGSVHSRRSFSAGRKSDCGKRIVRRQVRGVDLGPCLDDGEDLRRREVCEGEIVGRGKGEDVAFSFDGFGAKEEGREI